MSRAAVSATSRHAQHPVALLRRAPFAAVLHAWGTSHVLGILDDDAGLRILCPRCGHVDQNGPTAAVEHEGRIACPRCRRAFTRAWLERLILEDADLLDAFLAEVADVPT